MVRHGLVTTTQRWLGRLSASSEHCRGCRVSTADVMRVPERREERAVRSWASEGKQADPAVTDGSMRVPRQDPGACSHDPSAAVDAAWAVFGWLSRRRTIANGADSDTIRTPAPGSTHTY